MGLRNWRIFRPFSGMIHDIQLRAPWYTSDWTGREDIWKDSETLYRLISGTVRIFFVNLLPALAYALDMYYRTNQIWGTNEVILASAIPAIFFAVFSCQPLTIVGVTGLIDLFGYTTYDIVTTRYGVDFLSFMAWVGIWAALMHWLIAIFNWCDYMKYVTDFSSTAFGMYVGIIYCVKGVELIVEEFHEGLTLQNGFLSCLIALLYFALTWMTTRLGQSSYLHRHIRGFCTDFSLIIWTIFFAGFAHIPGHLKEVDVRKYPVTQAFQPTLSGSDLIRSHGWFIHFWQIPVKWWFIAIPFAALVTALFYYDHNVSSLMAQARHYPLRKHAGFHWDFFLLGITTLVAGIIGIPFPNGLVPQAPVHTDSCAIMKYSRASDLDDSTYSFQANREEVQKGPTISRILEQRWTHFGMGLLLFGMMTRPMLVALSTVPRGVFAGVFLTVGWSSIESNPITIRSVDLLRDPIRTPTRQKRATVLFLFLQWITIAAEVAISQTIAAIGFPVIILLLIPLRWTWMLRWFSLEELAALDTPTAEAAVVLDSFGGAPEIQERTRPKVHEPVEKTYDSNMPSVQPQSEQVRRRGHNANELTSQSEPKNPFTLE